MVLMYNSFMCKIIYLKGLNFLMRNIVKSIGAAVCAAALLCSAGCTGNTKWSFKTANNELSSGQWILYTFEGLNSAIQKLSTDEESASVDKIDWDSQQIENMAAKDWIYAEAKKSAKRYLTLEELAAKYGAEADNGTYVMYKSQYGYFYENFYKTLFEKLGIAENSYIDVMAMPSLLEDAVFTKMYGKGGEKEVSDDEVKKYFTDNYVAYYYVTADLETTDEETSEKTEVSADEKETIQTNFRKYAVMLNDQGKTTDDVTAQYLVDFSVDTAPTTDDATDKSEMTTGALNEAILAVKEGTAETKELDGKMYLIYRYDINTKTDSIKGADDDTDGTTSFIAKEDIVKTMKHDEFEDFIKEQMDALEYDRNDACVHKYDVSRTINIVLEQTKSS